MDQQAIEKIQHTATKLIPELKHDSYQEHLSKLLSLFTQVIHYTCSVVSCFNC